MNELKKYELTDETKEVKRLFNCFVLHRIRALKDFGDVHAGDLGGWVESEENLSHSGDAWVYTEAEIFGHAAIFENAKISGHAAIFENAKISGHAEIFENAEIFGHAVIFENAEIGGHAAIFGNAEISGHAAIFENAKISGHAMIFENAEIGGHAEIFENAEISGHAAITKATDILTISPIGSRNDTTTFYKSKNNKIFVKCGCKNTDIDTWLAMVEETHGNNKHGQAYRLAAQIARLQIELTEENQNERIKNF